MLDRFPKGRAALASMALMACLSFGMAQTDTAKVRCSGVTKAKTQCKRMVAVPASYCWQHAKQSGCTTDQDCARMVQQPKKSTRKVQP